MPFQNIFIINGATAARFVFVLVVLLAMYLRIDHNTTVFDQITQFAKRNMSRMDWRTPIPGTSFDAAGLIALADLSTIAHRTALTGTAAFMDALVLCPGIHRQQRAPEMSNGELPPTAALTSGYIFRVENQATTAYLQSVGKTGQLVTLTVGDLDKRLRHMLWRTLFGPSLSPLSLLLVMSAALLTATCMTILLILNDWWGVGILLILIFARLLNIILIRRRAAPSWHGAPEPGVMGDLLILLSEDRWIRLKGSVDALKAITSGQWLNEMNFWGGSMEATATILVYLSAALANNATQTGKILLIILLLVSVGLLGISNTQEGAFYMHNHVVRKIGRKAYARRLDLAHELIRETKRHDWAVGLGMVNAKDYGEEVSTRPVVL